MKWIISDYIIHKTLIQKALDRQPSRDRREIAVEYSACVGVPLAVVFTFLQDLTDMNMADDIRVCLEFCDAELVA